MSIKDKPLKKCHSDTRITLDVIHNDIISDYNKDKSELIRKLKIEKDNIIKKDFQDKIDKIDIAINEYYLTNGLILNDYYNQDYTVAKKQNKNNILDFFKEEDIAEDDKIDENEGERTDIIITYLSNIDDTYLNENLKDIDEKINICINCKNEHLIYKMLESEIYCNECGYTEKVLFENDKTSYKETPKEISYFAYKRINHFNEWISQFQGKETTDIPEYVYKDVFEELKKDININLKDVTNKQIRQILKKLKYNKYYENIPNIMYYITGNKSPVITREYEELLRNMFKETQSPFMKHCPDNRKNYLSYSYVLHKFCELLELDHLLIYFPFLKSRVKLQQQDFIWKKICNDLEWQFIPSI